MEKFKGKVTTVFGNDINTDDIIPAWTLQESYKPKYFADHAFEKYDKNFIKRSRLEKQSIIVAGKNFGCGSSREQAVYAIQENNIVAVIAESYPDIFYRNSLNNGLILITIKDSSIFKENDTLEIDLNNKVIKTGKEEIAFEMSDLDTQTFAKGGTIGKVQNHLTEIIEKNLKRNYKLTTKESSKAQTIVEKIVSAHMNKNVKAGERIKKLPIDLLFFNEVIGPPAIEIFNDKFGKTFKDTNSEAKVFDPKRIFMIPDHTVPSCSVQVSNGITTMQNFSKEQGMKCYKEGDGIEHVLLIEDGYTVPGEIILGTDSHTDTNGALNTLSFGVGTTDGAFAMATGNLYDFIVPDTIRINLEGNLPKGVYGKDIVLYMLKKIGVAGASRKVLEIGGNGLESISMDNRTTIANMAVEMGARTAIFEGDKILKNYVQGRAKFDFTIFNPDKDCKYEKTINIDISKLEPMIAFPHKPDNVTGISKIDSYIKSTKNSKDPTIAEIKTKKINAAFIGACTNGRYEDFIESSKILKGKKIHPNVNLIAIPASRKIYNRLMKEGILEIFANAGANIESSNCGPCFGKHMGVIGDGGQVISSSNRNYIGRMGSEKAKVFLASPATVARCAIKGEIC